MTKEQVQQVLAQYEKQLRELGYKPNRLNNSEVVGHAVRTEHILWMCVETQDVILRADKLEKAMRWLGFIQCGLWLLGFRSIEEMKRDNMPAGEQFDGERV
jgi:hypothetical protein